MYYLNKIVWFFLNPMMAPLAGLVAGFAFRAKGGPRLRRWGLGLLVASTAFIWFSNTLVCVALLGLPLERPYLATQKAETLPEAEAIVLLGGGMLKTEEMAYPDMNNAADRVWHAARLYKAGKAPLVVVSGVNDLASTVPLLEDLGVPREKILVDDESRNTYENSRFAERTLGEGKTVLLVTSAWHMPRALGNFSKTSLKAVPAAADFMAHNAVYGGRWHDWFLPSPGNADLVNALAKEWLGKLARK